MPPQCEEDWFDDDGEIEGDAGAGEAQETDNAEPAEFARIVKTLNLGPTTYTEPPNAADHVARFQKQMIAIIDELTEHCAAMRQPGHGRSAVAPSMGFVFTPARRGWLIKLVKRYRQEAQEVLGRPNVTLEDWKCIPRPTATEIKGMMIVYGDRIEVQQPLPLLPRLTDEDERGIPVQWGVDGMYVGSGTAKDGGIKRLDQYRKMLESGIVRKPNKHERLMLQASSTVHFRIVWMAPREHSSPLTGLLMEGLLAMYLGSVSNESTNPEVRNRFISDAIKELSDKLQAANIAPCLPLNSVSPFMQGCSRHGSKVPTTCIQCGEVVDPKKQARVLWKDEGLFRVHRKCWRAVQGRRLIDHPHACTYCRRIGMGDSCNGQKPACQRCGGRNCLYGVEIIESTLPVMSSERRAELTARRAVLKARPAEQKAAEKAAENAKKAVENAEKAAKKKAEKAEKQVEVQAEKAAKEATRAAETAAKQAAEIALVNAALAKVEEKLAREGASMTTKQAEKARTVAKNKAIRWIRSRGRTPSDVYTFT